MTRLENALGGIFAYLILHPPRRRPHKDPSDFGLSFAEQTVRTRDGHRLACWLVGPDSRRVAVLGHGIGQGKSASLRTAQLLVARGYQVLMFDHRGHGASQGDRRIWRVADRFTDDIVSASRWMAERSHPRILVVFGYSFSTFPTVYALASGTLPADAVVCESGPGLNLAGMFEGFLLKASERSTPAGPSHALSRVTARNRCGRGEDARSKLAPWGHRGSAVGCSTAVSGWRGGHRDPSRRGECSCRRMVVCRGASDARWPPALEQLRRS